MQSSKLDMALMAGVLSQRSRGVEMSHQDANPRPQRNFLPPREPRTGQKLLNLLMPQSPL